MIRKQLIREGKFVAEVELSLISDDSGWGPYVGPNDIRKMDRVRRAMRDGDLDGAAREAHLFELLPISA